MFGSWRAQQDGRLPLATPIANGATVNPTLGCSLNGLDMDVRNFPFFRFGSFMDQPIRIDMFGSLDMITYQLFDSVAIALNVLGSVYSFPDPKNKTGFYVLPFPFFRLQLTNTGAAATTVQNFWFWVQNYR